MLVSISEIHFTDILVMDGMKRRDAEAIYNYVEETKLVLHYDIAKFVSDNFYVYGDIEEALQDLGYEDEDEMLNYETFISGTSVLVTR